MDDHEAWRERALEGGARPTPVIDRFWFHSIYFREPSGVLFEIATLGPGFSVDEDPEHLGEALILPPAFEHLRDKVEPMLTPLPDPRGGLGAPGEPRPPGPFARSGEPEGALVLLHGRGADENDLFPLFDALDPERPARSASTPRGPLSLPPGGAHWYVVHEIGYPGPCHVSADYELRRRAGSTRCRDVTGVPLERTVLGGFSQGCVMTYALGLGRGPPGPGRHRRACRGFMPTVAGFELDLSGRDGFPAAIGHGTHDPIIGVEWGRDARERLTAAGADVALPGVPDRPHDRPALRRRAATWLERLMVDLGAGTGVDGL